MKKTRKTMLVTALFVGMGLLAHSSSADEALAEASGCLACHKIDTKLVGPAYKEVAAKYKDDPGAREMLIKKVKEGGVGTWGNIPMPPNAAVSDEDIGKLVDWILAM